jgi:hypothetical protein
MSSRSNATLLPNICDFDSGTNHHSEPLLRGYLHQSERNFDGVRASRSSDHRG